MTSVLSGYRGERYALVSAAHELILQVLPFRHRFSREALDRFAQRAAPLRLRGPDLDAVLLSALSVLEPHTHGRLPSMIDRYLGQRRLQPDPLERFRACVLDVIRYRGVGSRQVQHAIAIIEAEYADCGLTQAEVAARLDVSPSDLSSLFTRQTGLTFSEYLRDVRLDRSARLLGGERVSIKEIWAAVGYNDASNFSHQFKVKFGVTPRDYRARVIHCEAGSLNEPAPGAPRGLAPAGSVPRGTVLIVEDNDRTRETLRSHLEASGYAVALAATGTAAFAVATSVSPAAIVLDEHLPDIGGLEWLRRVRERQQHLEPPALLFTADWDLEDRTEELASLGATFASKLCDLDEVERLIASLVALRGLTGQ